MDNQHYARILEDVAALLQIKGENRYRVRAFENAAQTIERLSEPLDDYVENDTLEELSGIGSSIASDIRQIRKTGTCKARESLLDELDPGLLELLAIQGLGPKRVQKIYEELDITTIDALEASAEANEIRELRGFGPKTEQKIIDEIDRLSKTRGRTPLPAAQRVGESLRVRLLDLDETDRVDVAGSLRRGRETIGDVDLLVSASSPSEVNAAIESLPEVDDILSSGEAKTSVRLMDGLQVDFRFVDEDHYGAALQYFTGSKEHHVELRTRAKKEGLKISEYGVFHQNDEETPIAARTEKDLFAALDLDFIPAEIREGAGEIDAAASGALPDLISETDVRCDLHMHTTETDGSATIVEMGRAAREAGLDYIAITDHSEAVTVANGMTPERFEAQIERIREVDAQLDEVRVLPGIEVDILTDGGLDMDHDLLAECDWVVGSVHSQFGMEPEAMTDRLLAAIESGLVSCLGHPTGRILGGRDGYDYDFETVVKSAAKRGVALEINGSAGRIDLNADLARLSKSLGAKLVLGSDAHSTRGLEELGFAVQQARRAWLTPEDVLNTLSVERLTDATPPN